MARHLSARALNTQVDDWNSRNEVGVAVEYWKGPLEGQGRYSVTRTAAQLLQGHTPCLWVEGEPGCIALTHVRVRDLTDIAADIEKLSPPDRLRLAASLLESRRPQLAHSIVERVALELSAVLGAAKAAG